VPRRLRAATPTPSWPSDSVRVASVSLIPHMVGIWVSGVFRMFASNLGSMLRDSMQGMRDLRRTARAADSLHVADFGM